MLMVSLEFLGLALIVIIAGIFLTFAADQIAEITKLGKLLIGSILLAGATSLPELSVDISAVRLGMVDLATGDLLGSSLMNLLILAVLDLLHRSGGKMLTREAAAHALSATLSVALTGIVGMAIVTAGKIPDFVFLNCGLWSWAILAAYAMGVRMVFLDQRISARRAADAVVAESKGEVEVHAALPLWKPVLIFVAATAVIVLTGPRMAHTAGRLADMSGLGKTFVGTTLVAISTSLPELVASLTALRMGAHDLVIGNVLGSNAFNMILFVPLDALGAGPFFTQVSASHTVTCMAVIIATSILTLGQLYRVEKRWRIIEPDALLMIFILLGALWVVYQLSTHG
jgi:cation:H+ antiporter